MGGDWSKKMKILKLHKSKEGIYYCLFDVMPKITYEKIGSDYIGSATDENGNIIFSDYLGYSRGIGSFVGFAGREITLPMKDGTVKKIKDHWWDCGSYEKHGEFIAIGCGTLKSLQECYVYCSYNINKTAFEKMLDEYYSREKEYGYKEIEDWCRLQYKWYDVVIGSIKYPIMVNYRGDFVDKYSKKPIYPRINREIGRYKWAGKTNKYFPLCLFKYNYKNGDRLVKIEKKMTDVLCESLPYTLPEIIENCKINI